MAKSIVAGLTVEALKAELSYNPETGVFTRITKRGGRNVGDIGGYINKSTHYVIIRVCGANYLAHRLAWLYVHGKWPDHAIDHKNRCKSDNRISNLRDIEQCENARNTAIRKTNTSGVTGVYWNKRVGRWMVLAFRHGKQISLGYFREWFDAVCARKAWERLNPIQ